MNKAQAQTIAKESAITAYKLTMKKLAQFIEPGAHGEVVTTDVVNTPNPGAYQGHVANTGGDNVLPAADKAVGRVDEGEAASIKKFVEDFTKVFKRAPTEAEIKAALAEMYASASSKSDLLKTAAKFEKFLAAKK